MVRCIKVQCTVQCIEVGCKLVQRSVGGKYKAADAIQGKALLCSAHCIALKFNALQCRRQVQSSLPGAVTSLLLLPFLKQHNLIWQVGNAYLICLPRIAYHIPSRLLPFLKQHNLVCLLRIAYLIHSRHYLIFLSQHYLICLLCLTYASVTT